MCFGVCSCGQPLPDSICDNCGTIRPITQVNWRAPDYARPRTIDEWQNMRKNQLHSYDEFESFLTLFDFPQIIIFLSFFRTYDQPTDAERPVAISFSDDVTHEVFERYRFRNTLTDEGMLMEECPEAPGGWLFFFSNKIK